MYSTAMILAAGFGKRLQPLTLTTPKPLLPISGIPCITHIINALKLRGVEKIIINTHYLHTQFNTLTDKNVHLIYEPEVLETGGGIVNALPHLADPLLVINGDIWINNFDILDHMFHTFNPDIMDGLLMMVPLQNAMFFEGSGDYIAHEGFLKTVFPLIHKSNTNLIPNFVYGGIQVWRKDIFNSYETKPFSMISIFHQTETKNRLWGIHYNHLWCDIGTINSYYSLNDFVKMPLAD